MNLWKTTAIISFLCALPYAVFFGTRSYFNWVLLLILAVALAFVTMYYVLFKATQLPKKTT